MPFYIKYVSSGLTIVKELTECKVRTEAVEELNKYRKIADDNSVSLTSDLNRFEQWQKIVKLEAEITPINRLER